MSADTLQAQMHDIGRRARDAAKVIALASSKQRTAAIEAMGRRLRAQADAILEANTADIARGKESGLSEPLLDRLLLDKARLRGIADGIDTIAVLADPVGEVIAEWSRPNGLRIERVRTPIGVIGMIFESRPNVAADAGALALRSGNALILRGGSDSAASVAAIVDALRAGLDEAALPADAIQSAPSTDRAIVGMMLAGLGGAIDVLIPRGGKALVARVQEEARVPVFAHLEGICHTYIHSAAAADKAVAITVNAKMRRVSVCGATETLLIDRAVAADLLPTIADALRSEGCSVRGDAEAQSIVAMDTASEEDWRTEYLAPILAIRVVDDLGAAMAHIAKYGSGHTECIVTEDSAAAETFLREVDSAIVLHNASTQFADGGEFGFGGEIGIATGRLHARGPIGAEQLTTFKYIIHGAGQIRG